MIRAAATLALVGGAQVLSGGDHPSWRWVCTAPSESSTPTAGGSFGREDVTEEQPRALVEAVAVAAGCATEDSRDVLERT